MTRTDEIVPPAAEVGDVAGVLNCVGLAEEAFDFGAVVEVDGADSEGRGDGGDEGGEGSGGEFPDFQFDGCAVAFGCADEAGFWGCGVECVEAIDGGGFSGADEAGVEVGELMIEGLAGEMGADDGDFYPVGWRGWNSRRGLESVSGCAQGWVDDAMEGVGDVEEKAIVAGGGDETDAEWEAAGEEAGGDGDGAEVHEVDEVGVVAKVGV